MNFQPADKILVVDDNNINVLLTVSILEKAGFKAISANSGVEALEALQTHEPSLILLDVKMPHMSGLELCRLLKKDIQWKDIPIIFLTGNTLAEDTVEGLEAGGVDYITKPFNKNVLIARVKNHLELSRSRKMILDMAKTRDQLYSIIAHDIRSPLSGIQQIIDVLNLGFITPDSNDFKELMMQLGERTRATTDLLNSMLEWTRLKNESILVRFRSIEVAPMLSSCIQILEGNAQEKNISVKLDIAPETYGWFDEDTMLAVFRNLLSNAIKFTPAGGSVLVACTHTGQSVNVSFADTGVGIDAKTLNQLLNTELLISSKGTNGELGTGFGLLLVKDFIQKNNGSLHAESTPGKGSTFIVNLPIAKSTKK